MRVSPCDTIVKVQRGNDVNSEVELRLYGRVRWGESVRDEIKQAEVRQRA
jgi:hypothetical protein